MRWNRPTRSQRNLQKVDEKLKWQREFIVWPRIITNSSDDRIFVCCGYIYLKHALHFVSRIDGYTLKVEDSLLPKDYMDYKLIDDNRLNNKPIIRNHYVGRLPYHTDNIL